MTQYAQQPPPSPPQCAIVDAVLDRPLTSADARIGERFTFHLAGDPALPGVGVVAYVRDPGRGGVEGELVVEPRFVERADGTRQPATLVGIGRDRGSLMRGRTRDVPGAAGAIGIFRPAPYQIAAGAIGVYNGLHWGGAAIVGSAITLHLVLGDEYLAGGCTLPTAPPHKASG